MSLTEAVASTTTYERKSSDPTYRLALLSRRRLTALARVAVAEMRTVPSGNTP